MIAPEDVAWADSCLTKDPEEFNSGWNSMKEALFEALNPQHDASPQLDAPPMAISSSTGDEPTDEKTDDFWSRYDAKDIFLPTYDESSRDLGPSGPKMDIFVPDFQLQAPAEDDIFKIWDLGVPPEEDDEFVKQLNKAFAESPLQPTASVPDYSTRALEGSGNNESIDALASGVGDLSLNPNSSST